MTNAVNNSIKFHTSIIEYIHPRCPIDFHVRIYLLSTIDEYISRMKLAIKLTTVPSGLPATAYKVDTMFYNNAAAASVVRAILKDNCPLSADPCRPQPVVVPPTPPSRRCNDASSYIVHTSSPIRHYTGRTKGTSSVIVYTIISTRGTG